VLLARLATGLTEGAGFWVGSTHFPASDRGARRDAGHRLQWLTGRLDGPWLICGDFNAEPSGCFTDDGTFAVSRDLVRPTFPAHRPRKSIDYCIGRPGLVMETTALPAAGSDHLPVLTTVRGVLAARRAMHSPSVSDEAVSLRHRPQRAVHPAVLLATWAQNQ
jgi:endonuclease/exonuclease/phosphatase family metal-dependent hydrolase